MSMSVEDRFLAVAEGQSEIEDPAAQSFGRSSDLLGKSGADLVPMMADGARGIADLTAEADQARRGHHRPAGQGGGGIRRLAGSRLLATLRNAGNVIAAAVIPVRVTQAMDLFAAAWPGVAESGPKRS
jgi:hypothetical protein